MKNEIVINECRLSWIICLAHVARAYAESRWRTNKFCTIDYMINLERKGNFLDYDVFVELSGC